jgi:ABC-type transporter Mla subunit MlaD
MPLQDLTPELRTRLNRAERLVGWFVIIATIVLLAGFSYYMYDTAKSRGWFLTKINYATSLNDFAGFKIGDPVKIMGFPAGEITAIALNSPEKPRGVKVFFNIKEPYYNFIWYDSTLAVKSDLLKGPYLEISKGQFGVPTVSTNVAPGKIMVLNRYAVYLQYKALTNELLTASSNQDVRKSTLLIAATNQLMSTVTNHLDLYYTNAIEAGYNKAPHTEATSPADWNYCWIPASDAPTLEDRLGAVASQVELAVPNILVLTNQLAAVLSNANKAVGHLNDVLSEADPVLANVKTITGNLRDPHGSLGHWLLPPKLEAQLEDTLHSATQTLNSAHSTLDDTDTNLTKIATDLDKSLEHLADLTGSLNAQVQANSNLVSEISTTIVHTDSLVEGLKREWFLRGAFKTKKPKKGQTNAPPSR